MRLAPVLIALVLAACSAPVAPAGSPAPSPVVTAPAPATPAATATSAPSQIKCGSGDPLAHVYHPARLQVLAPCVTVRGVILTVHQEPDGDLHVRRRVDAGQRDPRSGQFTNAINDALQSGALVLKPVCQGPATQADAVAACAGFHNPLVVPPVGSHVEVTGPWVLDVPHGWNELHPLQPVEVLR